MKEEIKVAVKSMDVFKIYPKASEVLIVVNRFLDALDFKKLEFDDEEGGVSLSVSSIAFITDEMSDALRDFFQSQKLSDLEKNMALMFLNDLHDDLIFLLSNLTVKKVG